MKIVPSHLLDLIHDSLNEILSDNPAATSSESYLQHLLEFEILNHKISPRYYLRIGINYHGAKVQHIQLNKDGKLIGWNPNGDALEIGSNAKMLLANHTIFDRQSNEPMMNDSKIGGGNIPAGEYIRLEFKVRGWLGKTKNLDGKQLEKDLDLLKNDAADLLIISLSETAHRKWRGEGPAHQSKRRTGTERFKQILFDYNEFANTNKITKKIVFEGQNWEIKSQLITGSPDSIMPGATHIVTTCAKLT